MNLKILVETGMEIMKLINIIQMNSFKKMEEIKTYDNIIILAATNKPWNLDLAIF
jgi:hypothetical protein